uniref:UAP56-interacting factor n=1 Tax=Sinocyclocheilus grahami TaxID=75366 RepID=A0A672T2X9_SINGR
MSRFVISQSPENKRCSPNEPFAVVLEKGFLKNEISPFGVDFENFNFLDLFLCSNIHYTLTKIKKKVKKHNRTPLNFLLVNPETKLMMFGFAPHRPAQSWSLHPVTPARPSPPREEPERKPPKGVTLQFDINSVGKQTEMTLNERFRLLKDQRVAAAQQSSKGGRFVTVA